MVANELSEGDKLHHQFRFAINPFLFFPKLFVEINLFVE